MSVTAFNPYDSNDWENYLNSEPEVNYDPVNLPNIVTPVVQPPVDSSETETEPSDVEIPIQQDVSEPDIIFTDLANVRELLASRTGYSGGRLGSHLKNFKGLLILPLHATPALRFPHGAHVGNPPMIVFLPTKQAAAYPQLDNFVESIKFLYNDNSQNAQ